MNIYHLCILSWKVSSLNFLTYSFQNFICFLPHLENENEDQNMPVKEEITIEEVDVVDPQQFKKPTDFPPEMRKLKREEESSSRPTREITSVMMTTSGFLSPAREGKLPEAKAPAPPPPPEVPAPPAPIPIAEPNVKKKVEKRKEKFGRELFKSEEKPVKKVPTMKDLVKMKQKSTAAAAAAALPSATTVIPITHNIPSQMNDMKLSPIPNTPKVMKEKIDKALAAAKAKTEKLNTTITPIPMKMQHSPLPPAVTIQQVEKLFNEPDKKKINIFKKISREGKPKKDSRSATPNLMTDETTDIVNKINQLSSDITIEPIHPMQMTRNSDRFDMFFDGGPSRPGTPLNFRTSDIMGHSPPMMPQKRKRQRDPNRKIKGQRKNQQFRDPHDFVMDRPKTPESLLSHIRQSQAQMGLSPLPPAHLPFPFLPSFGGPGLIPPQLATPMFPFSQFGGLPNFGKNPYFSPLLNMSSQMEPVPLLSPKVKDPPIEYKPAEIIPQVVRPAAPPQKPPPVVPTVPLPRPVTPVITPAPPTPVHPPTPPIQVPETSSSTTPTPTLPPTTVQPEEDIKQKLKEHKKEKKDKIKKKNKKDKEKKDKSEKKKLKELKRDNKDKVKKEKKIKKKEKIVKEIVVENPIPKILLKVNSPSPRPETPETMKKLNIKPVIKRDEEPPPVEININREPSPGGLAKISALVTGPPKPKSNLSPAISPNLHTEKVTSEEPPVVVPKTPGRPRLNPTKPKTPSKPKKLEQTFKKIDDQGNEVWICPACGQQDDGRPMIGCDGCDAWYHWVCVGIQVPPDENENWYCKPCLCKKNEDLQSDKKRKRKRKEKKEH